MGRRRVFLLAVPFGLVTLVVTARHPPPARSRSGSPDLDAVGLLLTGGLRSLASPGGSPRRREGGCTSDDRP
ncbi:hypothetical protein [Nonomuraea sp. NPDC001023]|uniref:hypothetical protein n=1 Tax=unclassified Nonomuraea TaxID=2593643 RepID=UPI00332263E2